jgi:hypothetical protein
MTSGFQELALQEKVVRKTDHKAQNDNPKPFLPLWPVVQSYFEETCPEPQYVIAVLVESVTPHRQKVNYPNDQQRASTY